MNAINNTLTLITKSAHQALIFFLLSLYTINLCAQQPLIYQPQQMRADLEKFKIALIKIHPGTYTHQSPKQFEQRVSNLIHETSEPLAATDFYKIVLKLIASIHDGHGLCFGQAWKNH